MLLVGMYKHLFSELEISTVVYFSFYLNLLEKCKYRYFVRSTDIGYLITAISNTSILID